MVDTFTVHCKIEYQVVDDFTIRSFLRNVRCIRYISFDLPKLTRV